LDKVFTIAGSIVMFLAVAAGAFGSHGLSDYFTNHPEMESTYQIALRYQVIHGLALFVIAWATTRWNSQLTVWAGYLFIAGIVVFSGSLFLLSFSGVSWLGAITPIGGVAFLAGWLLLALAAWRGI